MTGRWMVIMGSEMDGETKKKRREESKAADEVENRKAEMWRETGGVKEVKVEMGRSNDLTRME